MQSFSDRTRGKSRRYGSDCGFVPCLQNSAASALLTIKSCEGAGREEGVSLYLFFHMIC